MSTALKKMSSDEFLLWAEGKEGRWELHDGLAVMMSPEGLAHVRTKARTMSALEDAVRLANLPCEVFADGVSVKVDAGAIFQPDASVFCGPRRPDDAIVLVDPIVVVEVLSPNTAAIDHGPKLSGYFSLPSVRHYLILDPERRVAIHHERGSGDAIQTRVLAGGAAKLDPPGFEVSIEALFPVRDA